jgi:hypothetical protein
MRQHETIGKNVIHQGTLLGSYRKLQIWQTVELEKQFKRHHERKAINECAKCTL